jgi:hypothetical protein
MSFRSDSYQVQTGFVPRDNGNNRSKISFQHKDRPSEYGVRSRKWTSNLTGLVRDGTKLTKRNFLPKQKEVLRIGLLDLDSGTSADREQSRNTVIHRICLRPGHGDQFRVWNQFSNRTSDRTGFRSCRDLRPRRKHPRRIQCTDRIRP